MENPIKRVLLSVSDKQGITELARGLVNLGIEIISSGGTSTHLKSAGIPVKDVSELTGFPEMMDGRVKTLHPKIHGGILGKRDAHASDAEKHGISWIDLVVVNLYPFQASPTIENIDIGGSALIRASAKNHEWVGVVVTPSDYPAILDEITQTGKLSDETRGSLAAKAFAHSAEYDLAIAASLSPISLRYGENPHQRASLIQLPTVSAPLQLQGKTLSYNNYLDISAAVCCLQEFSEPTAVIIKHNNPCGIASRQTIESAWEQAWLCDTISAFGGVIALNRPVTENLALRLIETFWEVIIAPEFTPAARDILRKKNNLRLMLLPTMGSYPTEIRSVLGGILLQERDTSALSLADLKVVTTKKPTELALQAMLFSWKVVKHLKSNGIAITDQQTLLSSGLGQTSRIDSVEIALQKLTEIPTNAVLASEAFFPFRDSIDRIAASGIKAIIQPGGSIKDNEVIAACDEHNIAMVFTGIRCFKH